jgi:O-antigen/teichoic acid export membrane protein
VVVDESVDRMKLAQKVALNSSAQAISRAFLALAGIVSVAVATRYLTVDQYGSVLAAMVLFSLLGFATDFGISAMTVRAIARDPENETAIASSAFWVWTAFTLPTAVLILVASLVFYPGSDGTTTRESVLIMMAIFPLGPFAGVAGVRAIASQRVWILSIASILSRAGSLLLLIMAAVLDLGPLGIAGAFAAGYVLEQAFIIAFLRPTIQFRVGLHRARIWALVAAAVPLGVVMMINGLYFRLDAFLLSVLGTERDLALYGVAYKAFESLLGLPDFVMITLVPVLAKLELGDARFRELVQKAFTGMTILALPIIGLSVLGREMMIALGGQKYAGGGLVLTLIMCSVAFSCVQAVFGNALVTQGRQTLLLKVSVTILVANGLLNLAAIPLFGAEGAAGALLLTELLSFGFTLYVYGRVADLPRLQQPIRLATALAGLIVVALVCQVISEPVAAIVVGAGLGTLVYGGLLVALGAMPNYIREPFETTFRMLRAKVTG